MGLRAVREKLLTQIMVKGGPRYESLVRPRKQALLQRAKGVVLEIGAGTGPNLRYLQNDIRYLACEPNTHMHPYLQEEIDGWGGIAEVAPLSAEELLASRSAASVDTVISSLVLCSVPDQEAVLRQMHRVLRPGGELLLLEHVGAPTGSSLRICQHFVSPLFRCLADGCRPHRDTLAAIRAAGFSTEGVEQFRMALGPISPHICGFAVK